MWYRLWDKLPYGLREWLFGAASIMAFLVIVSVIVLLITGLGKIFGNDNAIFTEYTEDGHKLTCTRHYDNITCKGQQ